MHGAAGGQGRPSEEAPTDLAGGLERLAVTGQPGQPAGRAGEDAGDQPATDDVDGYAPDGGTDSGVSRVDSAAASSSSVSSSWRSRFAQICSARGSATTMS